MLTSGIKDIKLLNSTNLVDRTNNKLVINIKSFMVIQAKIVVINIEIHANKWNYGYKTA